MPAASAPTANSRESPGRNGVTTKPVSAKTMREKQPVDPVAVRLHEFEQMTVEVQNEVDEI